MLSGFSHNVGLNTIRSYFLGHAPPHHSGRGHPGSPSVFPDPSPPAERIKQTCQSEPLTDSCYVIFISLIHKITPSSPTEIK